MKRKFILWLSRILKVDLYSETKVHILYEHELIKYHTFEAEVRKSPTYIKSQPIFSKEQLQEELNKQLFNQIFKEHLGFVEYYYYFDEFNREEVCRAKIHVGKKD